MKLRFGFVTNSSSSSYIIATKEEVSNEYEQYLTKITAENVMEVIEEYGGYPELSYRYSDDEIKSICGFTDEQLFMTKLIYTDNLDTYIKVKEIIKENDKHLYYVCYDWNWIHYHPEVYELIRESEKIGGY